MTRGGGGDERGQVMRGQREGTGGGQREGTGDGGGGGR